MIYANGDVRQGFWEAGKMAQGTYTPLKGEK